MTDTTPKKTAAKKTASPSRPDLQPPTQAELKAERTDAEVWAELTKPFPEDWVEKLPKTLSREDRDKGRCQQGSRYSADGHFCNGWHARAVHLDYVGHAGITMRLNDVLGPDGWDFQPMAYGPEGLPIISQSTFWAKLTIMGVTKWELATNYSGPQEALGDALRRCAMRFGLGTYLWSKSDHAFNMAKTQEPEPETQHQPEDRTPARQENALETVPVHVQLVYDILGSLTEDQKVRLAAWWDQRAQAGQLPLRENMLAITPDQAAMVEDAVMAMVERDAEARQAAQDPQ